MWRYDGQFTWFEKSKVIDIVGSQDKICRTTQMEITWIEEWNLIFHIHVLDTRQTEQSTALMSFG